MGAGRERFGGRNWEARMGANCDQAGKKLVNKNKYEKYSVAEIIYQE